MNTHKLPSMQNSLDQFKGFLYTYYGMNTMKGE